jgi:LysR family glycine cleavage system transcriptional activator
MATKTRRPSRLAAIRPELIRRLPLSSLRVFVSVADSQSFTRAADLLGVSVSAVSMQIRSLEQYLGVKLFRRDGRLVIPTSDALPLLPRIREGMFVLQQALEDGRASHGSGAIYISVLPSFVTQWLTPRLADFQARHPRLHLRISASPAMDFHTTGMHAAIRLGGGQWPGTHAQLLLNEWLVPVCRPDLLRKLGPVESLDDLERYPLIHSTMETWESWLTGIPDNHWPETGLGLDDSAAVVRAAVKGVGLALARWSLVGDELRDGQLAIASSRITPFTRRYYFVCLPSMVHVKKVCAMRDWLLEQAAAFATPSLSSTHKAA